jgi:hypothetical protein
VRGTPRQLNGPGDHTYIQISDPNAGIFDILEGAPTKKPGFPNPFGGDWGSLFAWISGTVGANEPAPIKGDNPGTDTNVASVTGRTQELCDMINSLLMNAETYNNGGIPLSPYRPIPKQGSGYANSNSFTFTLFFDVAITGSSWTPPGWAPGWGIFVPGL